MVVLLLRSHFSARISFHAGIQVSPLGLTRNRESQPKILQSFIARHDGKYQHPQQTSHVAHSMKTRQPVEKKKPRLLASKWLPPPRHRGAALRCGSCRQRETSPVSAPRIDCWKGVPSVSWHIYRTFCCTSKMADLKRNLRLSTSLGCLVPDLLDPSRGLKTSSVVSLQYAKSTNQKRGGHQTTRQPKETTTQLE